MQIIDKYGYLENALNYIEKHIISGRGLQKTAKKAGLNQDLLESLSLGLGDFSEKKFLSLLQDKIEGRHGSTPGADDEVSAVDISIETDKNKPYILMNLRCSIVVDGELEDRVKLIVRIFSSNNIQINAS